MAEVNEQVAEMKPPETMRVKVDEQTRRELELSKLTAPIRLKLDDEQKLSVIGVITDEMEKIKSEYAEREYFDNDERSRYTYETKQEYTDFPIESASNRKIGVTTFTVDIITSKAKRQTLTANPVILLEKQENIPDETLRNHEDWLDYTLRNDVKLEDLDTIAYRMATLQGAAVVKVPFVREIEYKTFKEAYQPNLEDIARFEKSYARQILNRQSMEYKRYQELRRGTPIVVEVEEEVVTEHRVAPYRVPLDKFFARLTIKDLRKHRVIAERMDYSWVDIRSRQATGYYDSDAVDELKSRYDTEVQGSGAVDKPYDKRDYAVYESIVKLDLEDEGKYKRYIITFDEDTKIILRAVHYPSNHGLVHYVVYNAIPRDDSWLGYSMYERLKDTSEVLNAFVNATINEFTLKHKRIILTDGKASELGRKTIDDLSVLQFEKGSQFVPMSFQTVAGDRISFMSYIQTLGELISGVSAGLMSGRETPGDPRAPASKTAMKLQESNARVEDIVMNLQKGDEALAEQVDKLYQQYGEYSNGRVVYWQGGQERAYGKDIFDGKVRYVCHGSRLSFDRSIDLQIIIQTIQFLAQFYPEVLNDAKARYELLNSALNSSQGSVERKKDVLLEPVKIQIEAREALLKKFEEIKSQGGASPADEKAMLELAQLAQMPMKPPEAGQGEQR